MLVGILTTRKHFRCDCSFQATQHHHNLPNWASTSDILRPKIALTIFVCDLCLENGKKHHFSFIHRCFKCSIIYTQLISLANGWSCDYNFCHFSVGLSALHAAIITLSLLPSKYPVLLSCQTNGKSHLFCLSLAASRLVTRFNACLDVLSPPPVKPKSVTSCTCEGDFRKMLLGHCFQPNVCTKSDIMKCCCRLSGHLVENLKISLRILMHRRYTQWPLLLRCPHKSRTSRKQAWK